MWSWRTSVILLTLEVLLLGVAGTVGAQGHGTDSAYHTAVMLSDDALDAYQAVQADDDCVGSACCVALHCSSCAAVSLSGALEAEFSAERDLARIIDTHGLQGRSIPPPTAPPKSA